MSATVSLTSNDAVLDAALPQGVPAGLNGRGKRILDLAVTLALLILLMPFLLLIAMAIKLQDGGPVLYRHRRCGRHDSHFTLLKFRTMRVNADQELGALLDTDPTARADWQTFRKLRSDPRVTRLGAFLRRSSLDELPQLFNVLVGEMSLVGPRPVIDEELDRFGALAPVYGAARPGLTGLWQVSGRNETDFETRVLLDIAYVREWSWARDLYLLWRTVPTVLFARGAH